jgi:hypothetical protein
VRAQEPLAVLALHVLLTAIVLYVVLWWVA